MADLSNAADKEEFYRTCLHIKLTNNGMLIDGEWNNERFFSLLKCKLMQHDKMKSLSVCTKMECDAHALQLMHSIIHSGIYNEHILLELEKKGMPLHSIMKAMKYGLLSLSPEELKYFENFGPKVEDMDTWIKNLDERLIWNLSVAGLSEEQCWLIVAHGLMSQDENMLYRLLSSGIDVPRILNWPQQNKSVTPTIICFLKKFGIDEDTLRYVEESGIDDEIEDMLIDLGYNEYKKKEETEEIICECSLTILESPLEKEEDAQYNTISCTCNLNLLQKDNESLDKNNYLRQTVMVPLSWALSRALRYRPSDPKHYMAYQLLRWKYGNISEEEMRSAEQFVTSATIIMDHRLQEKHKKEEAAKMKKNIPCNICLERQKLYRVKERCWKCTRVLTSV